VRPEVAEVIASLAGAERILPSGVLLPSMGGEAAPESPPEEPGEPVYERAVRDDVQGNIIPGFNKDHQHFLFLRIADPQPTSRWLARIAPRLATMDDVLAFVRAHRSQRFRLGAAEPRLSATWVNLAFSHAAIRKLAGEAAADSFGEISFRQGLAARSTYLGDPVSPAHPGHRSRWLVGGPHNEADILVMVAADEVRDLDDAVGEIREEVDGQGLERVFEQRGDTLPGALRGHEHFGFKDGVSQPGIRGRVSTAPGDFITPRYLASDDPHARLFAKPGQPLVWPGQFLLGEPRQDTQDLYAPAAAASNFPPWARRGAYLVCRRLRQDVEAFWEFAVDAAAQLELEPLHFASLLVGRWPSGAPVMRTPHADDAALAGDEFANNHFLFEDATRDSVLRPIPGYSGDAHAAARGDVLGRVCPHFAHIRKLNPRDGGTELGAPSDTLLRLILRRGIPFGPPVAGVEDPPRELVEQERGLMFIAFAGTIEDQFEFITRHWANSAIQPRFGGHEPVMGQRDRNRSRERFVDMPGEASPRRLRLDEEWVFPTGGGYFFAPPISALAEILAAYAEGELSSPRMSRTRGRGVDAKRRVGGALVV
jgi:Dyp-type peroxidase family